MNRRLSTFRQRAAAGLATLALSAFGLAIGPAAPAHADNCAEVEVTFENADVCVLVGPLSPTVVAASGDVTVKNNTVFPVRVKTDTGTDVVLPPYQNPLTGIKTKSKLELKAEVG
jgi:hypothetical protein